MSLWCEMAGCGAYGATAMDACGTVYLCPACRALVESLSAIYAKDDAAEAAGLAEQAGASA